MTRPVTRPATRLAALAAAGVLAAGLPLVDSAPASAATCVAQTVPVSTRNADAVFTGTVTASQGSPRTDGRPGQVFTQTVSVERVYSGELASDSVTVQTDRIPKECTLGKLVRGTSYVFFVTGAGDPWLAAGGGGTAVADPSLVAEVEGILGPGSAPVAPEPEAATFEDLDVDQPARFTRVAAPGAALVIIGLLGLLLVALRRRRAA